MSEARVSSQSSKLILAPWFACIQMHIVIRVEHAWKWLPVTCQRQPFSLVCINPPAPGLGPWRECLLEDRPRALSCLLILPPSRRLAPTPRPCLCGPANLLYLVLSCPLKHKTENQPVMVTLVDPWLISWGVFWIKQVENVQCSSFIQILS